MADDRVPTGQSSGAAAHGTEIAVTGLDCRFPGAPDAAAFWRLLLTGADAVGPRPDSRWAGRPPREVPGPGGYLDDADAFDHAFFGIAEAEAEAMDPQPPLLLPFALGADVGSGIHPPAQGGPAPPAVGGVGGGAGGGHGPAAAAAAAVRLAGA
ncbi:beta-ketoacyl synthase N-terminal-like domain-containing protein [Kitasatospora sp. NPDC059571]|uniref:beta-ketoacyl synthase N-terminal-like domain-containing protein n=1 Tax=Kitasatospora sp. NPDC059571 TaxID=3346871 RepID=UPI0036B5F0FC